MEFAEPEWTALVAHPSTRRDAISGIEAHAQVGESGIVFRYVLRAQFSRVRIPPAKSAERVDRLWEHTCFEAFIKAPGKVPDTSPDTSLGASPGAASYYELNVAPSRQWAVYRFDAYREGKSSADLGASPEISVRRFDDRLEVDASLRLNDLIALQGAPRLQVALSAVIEEESGTLSYWALKHAPGKPDFHHPDGFALELAM
jgi:hypothetical protein